jgi:hypothetical protein
MHLGRLAFDPMLVAKAAGIASVIAVFLAVFLAARSYMHPWLALTSATMAATSRPVIEALAFGGYPQNYAVALLVLSTLWFVRYISTGSRGDGFAAALLLAGCALTHHAMFPFTLMTLAIVLGVWLSGKPAAAVARRRIKGAALIVAPALALSAPLAVAMAWEGYRPPLGVTDQGVVRSLDIAFGDSRWLWALVFGAGGGLLLAAARQRNRPEWQLTFAILASGLLGFAILREVRLIPILVVGGSLAFGLALERTWRALRHIPWAGVPFALAAAAVVVLYGASDRRAPAVFDFYRTMNPGLERTVEWVASHPSSAKVVVRGDRNDWPVGWWFEGLAPERVVVGSDLQYLAFPGERRDATLVATIFDPRLSGADAARLASANDVGMLVFNKLAWPGWTAWVDGDAPGFEVAYADGDYMVVAVRPTATGE